MSKTKFDDFCRIIKIGNPLSEKKDGIQGIQVQGKKMSGPRVHNEGSFFLNHHIDRVFRAVLNRFFKGKPNESKRFEVYRSKKVRSYCW
ncbi:MAG: hypothetical protein R3B45_02930 [Bdellovibrionota bacterium]